MSKKRVRRERARLRFAHTEKTSPEQVDVVKEKKDSVIIKFLKNVYENHYKILMMITFVILILAVAQIAYQTETTGDFIKKGVSLKGGITITVPDVEYSASSLEGYLKSSFPNHDISVRTLTGVGGGKSITVDADITKKEDITRFESEIVTQLNIKNNEYSINYVGSSLGSNFFKQTIIAVIIAFILMAIVVSAYFRLMIPSLAVIVCAFSDIMITISIINIIGIKMSTGGIAAILMLIGYSVDTDILLSTRIFKRKEGNVDDIIYSSAKTGLTMTLSSIAAVAVALALSQSEALSQIMIILLIGLFVDIPNTWIQNTGIIKWYLERKKNEQV